MKRSKLYILFLVLFSCQLKNELSFDPVFKQEIEFCLQDDLKELLKKYPLLRELEYPYNDPDIYTGVRVFMFKKQNTECPNTDDCSNYYLFYFGFDSKLKKQITLIDIEIENQMIISNLAEIKRKETEKSIRYLANKELFSDYIDFDKTNQKYIMVETKVR